MYHVKTRNWNGNKYIAVMLALTSLIGVAIYDSADFDYKYYLETKSRLNAWLVWAYFMLFSPFSGGWTYIVRPGHELGAGYKSIY
jgi:hypothetical protein